MNLKRFVGLMGVLGIVSVVSASAFADDTMNPSANATNSMNTTVTKTSVHHKSHRHHRKVHHVMAQRTDYKDMGALPVQPATEVCAISQTSFILDKSTQSVGRAMPNPCNPGWFNRVQVSGGLNVDLGKWGNRDANIMGENYQHLSLNDAYLNVGAVVNDWAKAFASISYNDATTSTPLFSTATTAGPVIGHNAEYSAAYANNVGSLTAQNTLQLEQAYATFGNFDVSPVYLQVGKQFQDFSRYNIHPITYSLTQVLSETLATSAKLGFIASGFNGSIFVFDSPISETSGSSKPTDGGASLGFEMPSDQFGWDIGASWLYDLVGANAVAYNVSTYNLFQGNGLTYHHHVGGVAAYADMNAGPFSLNLRYTTAIDTFSPLDLPINGDAGLVATGAGTYAVNAAGAKPSAWGAQAGYGFDGWWSKTQNLYVGYQGSNQAPGLLLPKTRWLAGYNVDVWKDANVGIEWDHDNAYAANGGGSTNLVSLRAGVQFG